MGTHLRLDEVSWRRSRVDYDMGRTSRRERHTPIRTFAMTGMVTASTIDCIICGSLWMRDNTSAPHLVCNRPKKDEGTHHPGDASFLTDICRDALERHNCTRACFLRDPSLEDAMQKEKPPHQPPLHLPYACQATRDAPAPGW